MRFITIIIIAAILFATSIYADDDRKGVINEVWVSIDDNTYSPYDPVTGNGVVIHLTDDDNISGGTYTVELFGPTGEEYCFSGNSYNSSGDSERTCPLINTSEHDRIYLKYRAKSVGTDIIQSAYQHSWNLLSPSSWNIINYGTSLQLPTTFAPGDEHYAEGWVNVRNVPGGRLYFRLLWAIWANLNLDSKSFQWVQFAGENPELPSLKISPSNQLIEPLGNYPLPINLTNTLDSQIKVRIKHELTGYYDGSSCLNCIPKTQNSIDNLIINPGESYIHNTTVNIPDSPINLYCGIQSIYVYLYESLNSTEKMLKRATWPRFGYGAGKYLIVKNLFPRVSMGGGQMKATIFYTLINSNSPNHEIVNPGDMNITVKIYDTKSGYVKYESTNPNNESYTLGASKQESLTIDINTEDYGKVYELDTKISRNSDDLELTGYNRRAYILLSVDCQEMLDFLGKDCNDIASFDPEESNLACYCLDYCSSIFGGDRTSGDQGIGYGGWLFDDLTNYNTPYCCGNEADEYYINNSVNNSIEACCSTSTDCVAPDGSCVSLGISACFDNDIYTCTAGRQWQIEDCFDECGLFAAVDTCNPETATCEPCQTTCVDDAECDTNECARRCDGRFICMDPVNGCVDRDDSFLDINESFCYDDDAYLCDTDHDCIMEDCYRSCGFFKDVNTCTNGICGTCDVIECIDNSDCDSDARCNKGKCIPVIIGFRLPVQKQLIPSVEMNESQTLKDVYDLDDYFSDPDNDILRYSYEMEGGENIDINIDVLNSVSIKSHPGWTGKANITYKASDNMHNVTGNIASIIVYPYEAFMYQIGSTANIPQTDIYSSKKGCYTLNKYGEKKLCKITMKVW